MSWRSPAAVHLKYWPLHTLKQFADDVNVGWENLEPWIWGWVVAELLSLPALLGLHYQGQLFHFSQMTGGARLTVASHQRQDLFSSTHATREGYLSSSACVRCGTSLSQVVQVGRRGTSSPALSHTLRASSSTRPKRGVQPALS